MKKRFDWDDMRLLGARPESTPGNATFTDIVMRRVVHEHEIMTHAVRTISTNQSRKEWWFMKKLRTMPLVWVIVAAVVSVAALGGVSYAAYQLWLKPNVQVSEVQHNQSGRTELKAVMGKCQVSADHQSTVTYELKKNAIISDKDIPQVVQAQCELDAIAQWANETAPAEYQQSVIGSGRMVMTSLARAVESVKPSEIVLASDDHENGQETVKLDKDTMVITNEQRTDISRIVPGDTVVVVTYERFKPEGGQALSRHVKAIVKLALPLEMYDPLRYQSLTELIPCQGNGAERCKIGAAASIDVYTDMRERTGTKKQRTLDGVITNMTPSYIVLRGSSGAEYTIRLSEDIVNEFHTTRAHNYQNMRIGVGDSLGLRYYAEPGNMSRIIEQRDLESMVVSLEMVGKADPLNKY